MGVKHSTIHRASPCRIIQQNRLYIIHHVTGDEVRDRDGMMAGEWGGGEEVIRVGRGEGKRD